MTNNESHAIQPFLDGTFSVEIDDGRFLIFQEPRLENGNSVIQGRIAGESRIYRFWKKSSWTLKDGKKSRWYLLTDSTMLGETHNFIISVIVEVNENGTTRHFQPKEFQVAEYDPSKADKGAGAKASQDFAEDVFIPKQRDVAEVFRKALEKHDPEELVQKQADAPPIDM